MAQELEEVIEIRKKILSEFGDLKFIEEGHKYFLNGEQLPSVSEITHRFSHEFNTDEQAERYAMKHGETAEYWKDRWRWNSLLATTKGTLVHEYGESLGWLRNGHPEKITPNNVCKYIKDKNWLIPTRKKEEAILKFYDELNENLHFVLAETKVYTGKNKLLTNLHQNYCGTFDILFYYKDPKNDRNSGLVIFDYKGLPLYTPIPTSKGWKNMGDLTEDDILYDKDGNETTIQHISEIHHNKCYVMSFDNGDKITCDFEHRWEIDIRDKEGDVTETRVMTTEEIREYLKNEITNDSILTISQSKPLKFNNKKLPFSPYIYGTMLFTKEYHVIKANQDDYLLSSYDDRMGVLKGICDTFGEYDERSKTCTIKTLRKDIVDYVYKLSSTCGIKPIIGNDEISFKMDNQDEYRIITNIEDTDMVPTRCIEVDSPSHTFLCGYNCLVTHNTNKELRKDYSRNTNKMLLPPFDDLYDESLGLYTLQLSCYQIPLEDIGLKVIGRRIVHLHDDGEYELVKIPDVTEKLRNTL